MYVWYMKGLCDLMAHKVVGKPILCAEHISSKYLDIIICLANRISHSTELIENPHITPHSDI